MTDGPDSTLIADGPISTVEEHVSAGGGQGLALALEWSPEEVIGEVKRSGLRGRGGAGFPTGAKWEAVRGDPCPTKYVVCNAAEGEPGTFKDRWLIRRNPYQVIEGIAIAAYAVGAKQAFIGIKRAFETEIAALGRAIDEMGRDGMLGSVPIDVVVGPDEYLFGEEKALVEVIEGNEPLPRVLPPYMQGLFAEPRSSNPTAVNNVETLANIPHIIRRGADWFRSLGSEGSPGTMVFTLSGDVQHPGLYELPLGLPLRTLIYDIGGGPPEGRAIKAIFPGASNTILSAEQLDTPMDFDSMKAMGSGLGSAGFVAYDESACIVRATLTFSRFLYVESCAQCPACKFSSGEITAYLERIERGEGSEADVDTALARCLTVTDGQRCALPTGESLLVQSAIQVFGAQFKEHLGRACPRPWDLPVPKFLDFDERAGRFVYDERYRLKQPDWTYTPEVAQRS
ncbi:MAG: complex I 51 kDa subunit family protein [Actinomycetota bacterium]